MVTELHTNIQHLIAFLYKSLSTNVT